MGIRKQVYELTPADLNRFPVWEFASTEEGEDGQDEATVRPCDVSGSLNPRDGMFVVRAVFELANGSQMKGYLTPSVQGDCSLGTIQPVIVTDEGQIGFWYGMCVPHSQQLAENYRLLGTDADHAFPVQFESQVELVGGAVRGSLPGFLVLEDWNTMKSRIVR